MFILRRLLGEEGVETNTILGDSYDIVYRHTHPVEFQKVFDRFYEREMIDSGEIVAFVIFKNGFGIQPLFKSDKTSYIMTENGSTFSGRLTMR